MSKEPKDPKTIGYLPDETPPFWKLILYALQQIIVMFPATILVALLTGFHLATTIFASGFATIGFILVTKRKIPLYYGSSFSYLSAIVGLTGGVAFGEVLPDSAISGVQFGIIASGLVSIVAGIIISRFGRKSIEKVLPRRSQARSRWSSASRWRQTRLAMRLLLRVQLESTEPTGFGLFPLSRWSRPFFSLCISRASLGRFRFCLARS